MTPAFHSAPFVNKSLRAIRFVDITVGLVVELCVRINRLLVLLKLDWQWHPVISTVF
jgi:hypothetical protein